jgi:hypothetical protein
MYPFDNGAFSYETIFFVPSLVLEPPTLRGTLPRLDLFFCTTTRLCPKGWNGRAYLENDFIVDTWTTNEPSAVAQHCAAGSTYLVFT